jgi:bacteriocin-like protein
MSVRIFKTREQAEAASAAIRDLVQQVLSQVAPDPATIVIGRVMAHLDHWPWHWNLTNPCRDVPLSTSVAQSPRYVTGAENPYGEDMTGHMTLRQIALSEGSQGRPKELTFDELQQVIGGVRDVSTGLASGKRVHVPYTMTAT